MRLLVCGSRTFNDEQLVWRKIDAIYQHHVAVEQDEIVFHLCEGGAAGADSSASAWAHQFPLLHDAFATEFLPSVKVFKSPAGLLVALHTYHADWSGPCDPSFCKPGHRRVRRRSGYEGGTNDYCPAAGPRRNRRMLTGFKPESVLAFVDKPLRESRGTNDMVELSRTAGAEVDVVHG